VSRQSRYHLAALAAVVAGLVPYQVRPGWPAVIWWCVAWLVACWCVVRGDRIGDGRGDRL
jgi:hypothetical protein